MFNVTTSDKVLVAAGVVGLVALAWYLKRNGKTLVSLVNPADENNVVNQAATGFYQAVTGSTGSIGGDLYDGTHGGALDITSPNNFVNKGMEWGWQTILGDPDWTLGGKIYDWTH